MPMNDDALVGVEGEVLQGGAGHSGKASAAVRHEQGKAPAACPKTTCGNAPLHPDIKEILISQEQLAARVRQLGQQITRDYAGCTPVVISVLRGAAIFIADLVRQIDLPLEMDYMAVSSYGTGTKSSGVVNIQKDLSSSIEGRHVIVAEDILDSGLTLQYLLKVLAARNPASLEVASLLVKDAGSHGPVRMGDALADEAAAAAGCVAAGECEPGCVETAPIADGSSPSSSQTQKRAKVKCKYVGFTVPDEFIVGYGLDYAERYRNLPYIGTLHESVYNHR